MRLWHKDLLNVIDNNRLLGQHRECCALRGLGWGKSHSTVNYIFKYNYLKLYHFHCKVMVIMLIHNYNIDEKWWDYNYRGKRLGFCSILPNNNIKIKNKDYIEHNATYMQECLYNLKLKGVL